MSKSEMKYDVYIFVHDNNFKLDHIQDVGRHPGYVGLDCTIDHGLLTAGRRGRRLQ